MLYQIQEMLFVEGAPEGQLEDELAAYNPLTPQGSELVTTLMFEINDEKIRHNFLSSIGNVEEFVYMSIGDDKFKKLDMSLILIEQILKEKHLQFIFYILILTKIK
ncbi:MAG: hypothetical protein CM15mP109_02530 [Candidatus Dadabacteria bacterium]|nr:MAG: hypothetical protein CM15mP109_02530 [Candidatus Dadabacteria bacterium]